MIIRRYLTVLRAKTTLKVWNFYFTQILTEIVEKQLILTLFNLFSKFDIV